MPQTMRFVFGFEYEEQADNFLARAKAAGFEAAIATLADETFGRALRSEAVLI